MPNPAQDQKGQILLVSLLLLIVAMTVGLSMATRTINTLRTATADDSSKRAFAAAEAGIEQALTAAVNTTISGNLNTTSSYIAQTNLLSGDQFLVNNGSFILKDDSADIWLSDYPDYSSTWNGTLNIYWGNSSDQCVGQPESSNSMAAIEVVLLTGTKASPSIDHFAFDPCASRRNSNNFNSTAAGASVSGKNFAYRASIAISQGLLARIIPLYSGTYMGIIGTSLPPQGTIITSVGSSGDTQRKIVSFRAYPKAPIELYPYLIYSPK